LVVTVDVLLTDGQNVVLVVVVALEDGVDVVLVVILVDEVLLVVVVVVFEEKDEVEEVDKLELELEVVDRVVFPLPNNRKPTKLPAKIRIITIATTAIAKRRSMAKLFLRF
jgi:hypothetical protein